MRDHVQDGRLVLREEHDGRARLLRVPDAQQRVLAAADDQLQRAAVVEGEDAARHREVGGALAAQVAEEHRRVAGATARHHHRHVGHVADAQHHELVDAREPVGAHATHVAARDLVEVVARLVDVAELRERWLEDAHRRAVGELEPVQAALQVAPHQHGVVQVRRVDPVVKARRARLQPVDRQRQL